MTHNTRYSVNDRVVVDSSKSEQDGEAGVVEEIRERDSDSPNYYIRLEKQGSGRPYMFKASEIRKRESSVNIDNLSAEVIDGQTRHYDFSEGYPSEWEVAFRMTEEERMNERYMPMMNTLWPLPDSFEPQEQHKEDMDNMTIVALKEGSGYPDYYLALTGGGMDMSWQIGRTYVNLGYLPPAALNDLPRMANIDTSKARNRKVIEALKKTHEINKNSSDHAINKLEEM